MVHIIKDLVFTDHAPDKGVSLGAASGVDRPARGDDCLLVAHYNVACLCRLTHVVHDKGIFWHIEIQIDLHASVVCMARHCVPYASRLKFCHAHFQLAALYLTRKDIFADRSVVCCLQGTEFYFVAVLDDDNTIFRCAFRLDDV